MVKTFLIAILAFWLLVSCSGNAAMRALLAHTDSLNRIYAPLDTVSYMENVADYYDHWYCSDAIRMKAFYLLASVERDKGDSPLAIEHFNKSINFADTASTNCDYQQVSKIYGQIALIFHEQRYPQKELEIWKKAATYAKMASDTLLYMICQEHMVGAYWTMGAKERAFAKARNNYEECLRLGYLKQAACCLPTLFAYHLQNYDYANARTEITKYKQMSGLFDDNDRTSPKHALFYFYQGQYYEGVGKLDSALICYRKLQIRASKLLEKENCYKGLMSVFQLRQQSDSALKYSRLFAETNDEANRLNSANEVSRAQALFDYSNSQRVAKEKTKQLYALSGSVTIVVLILLLIIFRIHISKKKQKENDRRKFDNIVSKYSEAMYDMEQLKTDFKEFEQNKKMEVEHLRDELAVLLEKRKAEAYDAYKKLNDQQIIRKFREYARMSKTCSEESEWEELVSTIRIFLPDFYAFLSSHQNNTTSQEFRVCILTKLQFLTSEIVNLLGTSSPRVSNIRSKMNAKMFHNIGSKTFDANIIRI